MTDAGRKRITDLWLSLTGPLSYEQAESRILAYAAEVREEEKERIAHIAIRTWLGTTLERFLANIRAPLREEMQAEVNRIKLGNAWCAVSHYIGREAEEKPSIIPNLLPHMDLLNEHFKSLSVAIRVPAAEPRINAVAMDAWTEGAKAMREFAAAFFERPRVTTSWDAVDGFLDGVKRSNANAIRDLPLPAPPSSPAAEPAQRMICSGCGVEQGKHEEIGGEPVLIRWSGSPEESPEPDRCGEWVAAEPAQVATQAPAPPPAAQETLTAGQRAQISIWEHRLRLKVLFEENEARLSPDTALRVALLDADRVADELCDVATPPPAAPAPDLHAEIELHLATIRKVVDERDTARAANTTLRAEIGKLQRELSAALDAALARAPEGGEHG